MTASDELEALLTGDDLERSFADADDDRVEGTRVVSPVAIGDRQGANLTAEADHLSEPGTAGSNGIETLGPEPRVELVGIAEPFGAVLGVRRVAEPAEQFERAGSLLPGRPTSVGKHQAGSVDRVSAHRASTTEMIDRESVSITRRYRIRRSVRYHRNMKAGDAFDRVAGMCALAAILMSCGDDGPPEADPAPPVITDPTTATSTDSAATTSTEPKVEIPDGILAAMPTQNRVDPAKGQFQVKVINRTDERFTIVGVQFVWDGFTTALTERNDIVVSGQRIDLPVKFPGATCIGDGTLATMPDLASATARLVLDDGTERVIPVYDVDHLARRLYLEDCERQMIESLVGIEWVDLHTAEFDGRPVTAGELRLTRRASTATMSVLSVSNNVLFAFEAVDALVDGPVVSLAEGVDESSAPIRFIESRCDPHAISEASQPFKFVAQVDLGGGDVHPFIVLPPVEAQVPMRQTMEAACVELGEVEFLGGGEEDETG